MNKSKLWCSLIVSAVVWLGLSAGCITIVAPTPAPESPGGQNEPPPAAAVAAFATYTDDVNGFSISYPQDWQRVSQELLPYGELVAFWDFEEGKGFPPYMSVSAKQLAVEMDVDTFFETERQAAEGEVGYTSISTEDTVVDGMPALKHVFNLEDGDLNARTMQIYVISGQTAWLINCMCVPGSFDSLEPTFDDIATSFHLSAGETGQSAFTVYTDTTNGFSISYPQGWQIVPQDVLTPGDFIAFWDIAREDSFPPYVSLTNEQLPEGLGIDDYFEGSKQSVAAEAGAGYTFISREDLVIDNMPAAKHIFTLDTPDASVKAIQVYVISGQTSWIINCLGSPESFDSLEPTFQDVITSFQLAPSP